MKPILQNSITGFIEEPDLELGEAAMVGNLKLIEGVVATYPDDRDFLELAAMARANYAFAFLLDELEALRIAYPDDIDKAAALQERALLSYRKGRYFAERALLQNSDYRDLLGERTLEAVPQDAWKSALMALTKEDAHALFWLAFSWGGTMQVALDPAEATQLPKVEMMVTRLLELDEKVFLGLGPNLMAGVFYGFRSAALGGNPERSAKHFVRARELGDVLIPDVLRAQLVDRQTQQQESFEKLLTAVIAAKPRPDRGLLEALAKRKACRLLANIDLFFLADPKPPPEACKKVSQKYRLRESPIEAYEEEEPPAEDPAPAKKTNETTGVETPVENR